uniref:Uncharacterized protein n=1 Tax=Nelumbo nucifera TaxID=4432 RepID=A0A822YXR0_NELNU|nr:TPA_asm: hypothetical protein HUJ06_006941 [Nelumbo nucifera]
MRHIQKDLFLAGQTFQTFFLKFAIRAVNHIHSSNFESESNPNLNSIGIIDLVIFKSM